LRFLADENIPRKAVDALRAAGHDVAWIAEEAPSTTDTDVLARAVRDRRVLLTFDKDFGELAFRRGLPADCGIVLLRLSPIPDLVAKQILKALASEATLQGRFVVIEGDRIRERALPSPATVSDS
jgi:predicted nuclease of predicted toxin-antitoxin system